MKHLGRVLVDVRRSSEPGLKGRLKQTFLPHTEANIAVVPKSKHLASRLISQAVTILHFRVMLQVTCSMFVRKQIFGRLFITCFDLKSHDHVSKMLSL
jgi:hypothetical protein